MNHIISLNEAAECSIEEVGGKGANLAQLVRFGFQVPDGFIIKAPAYREFVKDGKLPHALVHEITEKLESFPVDQAFAVRSSGTMEDLAGAAFAGLHDTFLNVRGQEQILKRVKDCFLSLKSDRAAAYREERGFDHRKAAMAVVVQSLVPCDRAGVAFTVNPVNGNLQEAVIDANFGLGESVVGGETEVDHFVIDKESKRVKITHLAEGKVQIVPDAEGTRKEQVEGSAAESPCLNGHELEQITGLGQEVEEAFRFPQDIEWGLADGTLYVLQSRAITSIAPRWTREESAERYPKAITPLTWDFVDAGFHRSLSYSFRLVGLPAYDGKWFASHGHYIYGNQNAVQLYGRRAPFRIQSLNELRAALPQLRKSFRWVQELPIKWSLNLDNYLIQMGRFMAQPLEQFSLEEIWDFVIQLNEHGGQYFMPNIAISLTQSGLYFQLQQLLNVAVGEETTGRLFTDLTGYCETKTSMINMELYELVQRVRTSPSLEELIRTEASRTIIQTDALKRFPEFKERFNEFLRDHGHREVEIDPYYPTWIDAPWVVLDNLKLLLQNNALENPAERERTLKLKMQTAQQELFKLLPQEFHFFFFEMLRLTREYTRLDDLEHYHTTRMNVPFRRALLEIGRRLTERGILVEELDIFFARVDQIAEALKAESDSNWRMLTAEVKKQKAAFLKDQARTPEWVLGEADLQDADGDCLSGIPGSAGQAEGPVYLVDSADEFAGFPQGAVLIARTTNPSWTPMFYSAAAVITESGGPLSHGAVTAREVGIPAVMSVRGLMNKLKSGQQVRVDGTRGKVFIL